MERHTRPSLPERFLMRCPATGAALAAISLWTAVEVSTAEAAGTTGPGAYAVGVAKIDITPAYPVRLSGFGFRRTESEGVTQRIWAKALAVGAQDPCVLIAVENCGVPARLTAEVADRLARSHGIRRE